MVCKIILIFIIRYDILQYIIIAVINSVWGCEKRWLMITEQTKQEPCLNRYHRHVNISNNSNNNRQRPKFAETPFVNFSSKVIFDLARTPGFPFTNNVHFTKLKCT